MYSPLEDAEGHVNDVNIVMISDESVDYPIGTARKWMLTWSRT